MPRRKPHPRQIHDKAIRAEKQRTREIEREAAKLNGPLCDDWIDPEEDSRDADDEE